MKNIFITLVSILLLTSTSFAVEPDANDATGATVVAPGAATAAGATCNCNTSSAALLPTDQHNNLLPDDAPAAATTAPVKGTK